MKTWIASFFAVALMGCGSCQTPCKPNIPYPQAGSCPLPGVAAGDPGGKCPSWPGQCTSNTHCISGTCLPCGGAGEACCGVMETCDVGTCDKSDDSEDVCRTSCGQAGQGCCTGNECAAGLYCDVAAPKTCVPTSQQACNGNKTWYVGVVDEDTRCALDANIIVQANTAAEATTCAQSVAASTGLSPGSQLLPPQETANNPADYQGCVQGNIVEGNSTVHFSAFTQSDAQACLQSFCLNCMVSMGPCP